MHVTTAICGQGPSSKAAWDSLGWARGGPPPLRALLSGWLLTHLVQVLSWKAHLVTSAVSFL